MLYVNPAGLLLPLVILGLMGAQAALFSPAKYGILPEILPHERLSAANGLLEMWTFVAVIAGTAAGGPLLDVTGADAWIAGAVLTVLAVAGLMAARTVPRVPPARSEGGLAAALLGAWVVIRADRVLRLAIVGSTFFWGVVSLLSQDVLIYTKAVLGLSDTRSGMLLATFGVGVGAGAVLAGRLSASKVEYGLIPLGSIGFATFTMILGAAAPGFAGTLVLMALLGLASGTLIVPLNAVLQWRSPADRRGAVIALANVFVFTGILAGSLVGFGLSSVGVSSRDTLIGCSVATIVGTVWALWLLPAALVRLVLVLLTHTFYRVTVLGRERVPETGGALLVSNHVSFVDGLLILASLDRRVHFIVDADYFYNPFIRPFVVSLGAIPISSAGGPRVILRALRDAGRKLDEGKLVCIFAEGEITRTGMLLPFRRGMERIAKGRRAPIIPVNLDRVWGSIFSRAHGRFVTKMPEHVPYPVTVSFGTPLPTGMPLHEVRRAVTELGEMAWSQRKAERPPLHHLFVRQARRRPFGLTFADVTRPRLSRFGALAGVIALARSLRSVWVGQQHAAILMPPSVVAGLLNIAAALSGKASVNLNYTAGPAAVASAMKQCGATTVVTSRTFLERAKLELPDGVQPIWIEDVATGISASQRAAAALLALACPVRLLERLCGARQSPTPDDVVTVIFSSGSTGEPKGVRLTHFNIDSNGEAAA